MKTSFVRAAAAALLLIGGAAVPAISSGQAAPAADTLSPTTSPDTIVATRTTDRIKDLTTTLVVKQDETNRDELSKIGGAFATTYSFQRMNVNYQYPNKARFEGKSSIGSALLIYNGDDKMFKVPIPFVGKRTENVHGQPGQKQSLLDLGIFARDWLTTDWAPHFIARVNGLDEYRLSQRFSTNGSHEMVYVNPKTYIIARRISYNGDNKLLKELRFVNPTEIKPGIWVPTRIEIYNQYGKLGAVQTLEGTRVNAGVDPTLFDIK